MFRCKQKGASVAELGLLAGLIAVILIGSVTFVGDRTGKLFATIGNQVNAVNHGNKFPVISAPADMNFIQYQPYSGTFSTDDFESTASISVSSSNEAVLSASDVTVGTVENPTISFNTNNSAKGTTVITLSASQGGKTYSDQFSITVDYAQDCLQLSNNGVTVTGKYTIDLDGDAGPFDPLSVHCIMNSNALEALGYPRAGWTALQHDKMTASAGAKCEAYANCKVMDLQYADEDDQPISTAVMDQLISHASDRAQYFKKTCTHSLIVREYNGSTTTAAVAFTKVGSSTKVPLSVSTHFDGVSPECNLNDNVARSSDIYFVNKNDILPIGSVWGGDTGDSGEVSTYRFGRLYLR